MRQIIVNSSGFMNVQHNNQVILSYTIIYKQLTIQLNVCET